MALKPFFLLILTMLLLPLMSTARNSTRFDRFFPFYEAYLTGIRDHQCSALYAAQQQASEQQTSSTLCTDVLSCIMENTSEVVKGNMASGLVALGLMPTILTFLGSSTAETALLSRRRPLLALLIACGSPAVNPLPSFVDQDPVTGLQARKGRLLPHFLVTLSSFRSISIVVVEYLLILAAIANVITASYFAGLWSINTFACTTTYTPVLWVVLTAYIHISGMLALALRAEIVLDTIRKGKAETRWLERLRYEFTPCISQEKLVLKPKEESYLSVFISWFVSVLTVIHLLLGTVAFSSLAFIGYADSLKLIARVIASAIVCRAVLMFELAGMRNAMSGPIKQQPALEHVQYNATVPKHAVPAAPHNN